MKADTRPGSRQRPARQRLLDTADRLFYADGVQSVGIDRILAESGVAKGSLYYNFGSKDDLVASYLRSRHDRWVARIEDALASAGPPTDKVLAIFDALGALTGQADFRGCAFIKAAAQASTGSAGELATRDFRTWLHDLFGALVTEAGYREADQLTAQLVMLYDGANISAQLDRNPAAAAAARDAAAILLAAACSQGRNG